MNLKGANALRVAGRLLPALVPSWQRCSATRALGAASQGAFPAGLRGGSLWMEVS